MPLYVQSLGIGVVGWSFLAATLWFGMFVAEWIWGNLSDTVDRHMLMLMSAVSLGILSLLFTVRQLVPFFTVLMFSTGVLIVAIGPLTRSYVSTESPKSSIGFYTSLWWASVMLGRIVGPVLGAYIAQTWAFTYSFLATSIVAFVLAAFILASFPRDGRTRENVKHELVGNLKTVLRKRPARMLFLSALFYFMGPSLTFTFLPLYAAQQIHMSTIAVGTLIASVSCATLVSMPIVGRISDRCGRRRTTIVGLLASSGLFLLYFFAGTASQAFLVSIAIGISFSGTSVLLAMIPDVAPTEMVGTTVGVYGSFEDLGSIVAPLIFGFVWSSFGPIYIFAVASVAQLVGAFLVFEI